MRALGLEVARIEAPGTLDGGDVLQVGRTVYVGRGGRTNAEGIRQLRAALGAARAHVVPVPLQRVLHLKSAVTALPDGTVVGSTAARRRPAASRRCAACPRRRARTSSCSAATGSSWRRPRPRRPSCSRTSASTSVAVDIGEFEKLEGCVTCLSVLVGGG